MLLAKRFTLNPVLVIIALVFWFWMWGIPGAIGWRRVRPVARLVHQPDSDRIPARQPDKFHAATNGWRHTSVLADPKTVAVPLAERDGQQRLRSHAVIVFESFVAVAIDYESGHNKVTDFIAVLRAARETVTISYANKTFEYDVTQLPTADARFLQLCNQTSAH